MNHIYWKVNTTLIDYADYKVPTNSIQYYSYDIPLKDQRLRNTAGFERDGSVTIGYKGYNFHTELKLTDSYSRVVSLQMHMVWKSDYQALTMTNHVVTLIYLTKV